MNADLRNALADLIHDLELTSWPSHLQDKFREDLIRARILINDCKLAARKDMP